MTPQRWQEVKKVLAAVLERPPEERSVYLAVEIVEVDRVADFRTPWLERADPVGQVCGSSPHGPTILFNKLGHTRISPRDFLPVIPYL